MVASEMDLVGKTVLPIISRRWIAPSIYHPRQRRPDRPGRRGLPLFIGVMEATTLGDRAPSDLRRRRIIINEPYLGGTHHGVRQ
jgi:hypothetical protein